MVLQIKQYRKNMTTARFALCKSQDSIDGAAIIKNDKIEITFNRNTGKFKRDVETGDWNGLTSHDKKVEFMKNRSTNNILSRYNYHTIVIDGKQYNIYTVGNGSNTKTSFLLYDKKTQIAQIDKSFLIRDDLYDFLAYVKEGYEELTVFACLFIYVELFFSTGIVGDYTERKEGVKTTNRFVKAKYNPNFVQKILSKEAAKHTSKV